MKKKLYLPLFRHQLKLIEKKKTKKRALLTELRAIIFFSFIKLRECLKVISLFEFVYN